MDETYRRLGRAHEADLERDAQRWRLAKEVREQEHGAATSRGTKEKRSRSDRVRILTFARHERRARASVSPTPPSGPTDASAEA